MNSRFALGTVQFGQQYGVANQFGQVEGQDVKAILKIAIDSGIETIDTAISYGNSEEVLGSAGLQGFQVISKLPPVPVSVSNAKIGSWIVGHVTASLARLKLQSLYGFLLHDPLQLKGQRGKVIVKALEGLRSDGLVQKIGVSIYDPSVLDNVYQLLSPDIVQAPFSILDRRILETGWLQRIEESGSELHVRSIFLQGLLLVSPNKRPLRFAKWEPIWSEWDLWLEKTSQSPLRGSLGFVLSQSGITKIVIGVDSVAHIQEILNSYTGSFPTAPESLSSKDLGLINPTNWAGLDKNEKE